MAAERVNEILDMEIMIKDPKRPKEFLNEKKGEVEFKHVSFRYPDAGEDMLHDISLRRRPERPRRLSEAPEAESLR